MTANVAFDWYRLNEFLLSVINKLYCLVIYVVYIFAVRSWIMNRIRVYYIRPVLLHHSSLLLAVGLSMDSILLSTVLRISYSALTIYIARMIRSMYCPGVQSLCKLKNEHGNQFYDKIYSTYSIHRHIFMQHIRNSFKMCGSFESNKRKERKKAIQISLFWMFSFGYSVENLLVVKFV